MAQDSDPLDGLRWGAALGWFWWWRAYGDAGGRETSGPWPERPDVEPVGAKPAARRLAHLARARALVGAAYLAWRRGDYAEADGRFAAGRAVWAAELGGDDGDVACAASGLPLVVRWERHDTVAQSAYQDAVARSRAAGDPVRAAGAALHLGWLEFFREDWVAAERQFAGAERYLAAPGVATARFGRGRVAHEKGDLGAAKADYAASLRLLDGPAAIVPYVLASAAALAIDLDQPERAIQLAGAVLAPREPIAPRLPPALIALLEAGTERARASVDETRFAAAWTAGTNLGIDRAIALVTDWG